ncbi:MAG TPA: family 78 glycoside hydrolase catalytic domain [Puia sp.]
MNKAILLTVSLGLQILICLGQISVSHLTVDHMINPIGIDNRAPIFGWQMKSDKRGASQTAYEIRVWKSQPIKGRPSWTSGKVTSSGCIGIPYAGQALASGEKCRWRVRVWDEQGNVSGWSETGVWGMGMLHPSDWKAHWIGPGYTEDTLRRPSPLLRKTFKVSGKIRSATVFITAHGLYEAQINGRRVGEALFTPGWTRYDKRLQYQAYDVTGLVKNGKNAIGVTLGDGWYRGIFGQWNYHNNYGDDASLLLQLIVEYTDGTTDTVISDGSWKSSTGPIRYADLYNGEIYDARLEKKDWTAPAFDDKDWKDVVVRNYPRNNLVATVSPPVKEHETFSPVKIFTSPAGEQIIDFGQNMAGWVEFTVHGKAGDTVKLSHAEVLDKVGNFFTGNLREAQAQDKYILAGGEERLAPHFTFHGFRFVKVEGYPGVVKPEDFTAVSIYSDLPVTGTFTCSNPAFNQLQHNITWSQKSNFLDIPTDCPQRSERLGWCGDVQIFASTAAFNMQVDNFFAKWMGDLLLEQGPDGGMPNVIPNLPGHTLKRAPTGVAGWGDVATVLPWTLYEAYDDSSMLRRQYASMKAWVGHIGLVSRDYLWKGGGYGDWLAPVPTDLSYISQCWYGYSTQLLIKAARVLGKREDEAIYRQILQKIKEAFLRTYLTPDGRLLPNTQTAHILALQFDMLPDSMRPKAAARLAEMVHDNRDHLATGFLGTPFLLPVLTQYGYDSLAFRVLLQDTPPSWLYPVKMGATTIWEKWEALHPDGTPDSTSFNHYSYGAVGDWLYRTIAGIDGYEDAPGYKHSKLHPHTGGGLTYAAGSLLTPYGRLSSRWQWKDEDLTLEVEVPPNTTSTLYLRAMNESDITEDNIPIRAVQGVRRMSSDGTNTLVELGAGVYTLHIKHWQGLK